MFSLFWNLILVSSAYDPTSEPISLSKNCYLAQFSGVEFSICSTGSMPYPSPIPSGLEEIYPSLATSSPLLQGLFPSWLSLQIIEYGLYILCLYLSLSQLAQTRVYRRVYHKLVADPVTFFVSLNWVIWLRSRWFRIWRGREEDEIDRFGDMFAMGLPALSVRARKRTLEVSRKT